MDLDPDLTSFCWLQVTNYSNLKCNEMHNISVILLFPQIIDALFDSPNYGVDGLLTNKI